MLTTGFVFPDTLAPPLLLLPLIHAYSHPADIMELSMRVSNHCDALLLCRGQNLCGQHMHSTAWRVNVNAAASHDQWLLINSKCTHTYTHTSTRVGSLLVMAVADCTIRCRRSAGITRLVACTPAQLAASRACCSCVQNC